MGTAYRPPLESLLRNTTFLFSQLLHLLSSSAGYKVIAAAPNRILLWSEPKSKNEKTLLSDMWNSCQHTLTSILYKPPVRCPGSKPSLTLALPTPPEGLKKSGSSCCAFTETSCLQKNIFKNLKQISRSYQESKSWTNIGRRTRKQIRSVYPVYYLASNNLHLRDFKSSELTSQVPFTFQNKDSPIRHL